MIRLQNLHFTSDCQRNEQSPVMSNCLGVHLLVNLISTSTNESAVNVDHWIRDPAGIRNSQMQTYVNERTSKKENGHGLCGDTYWGRFYPYKKNIKRLWLNLQYFHSLKQSERTRRGKEELTLKSFSSNRKRLWSFGKIFVTFVFFGESKKKNYALTSLPKIFSLFFKVLNTSGSSLQLISK